MRNKRGPSKQIIYVASLPSHNFILASPSGTRMAGKVTSIPEDA